MKRGSNRAKGRYLQNYRGSGCDVGGRIVAPDARDPRIESIYSQIIYDLSTVLYTVFEKTKKETGNSPIKNRKIFNLCTLWQCLLKLTFVAAFE